LSRFCSSPPHQNCIIDQAFATGETKEEIVTGTDRKKRLKFYRINIFPAASEAKQAVVFIRDITESKQAEEEIRRLHEFNQRILDTAPISIAALDPRGRVVSANKLAKKLMDDHGKPIIGASLIATKEIARNADLISMYNRLCLCWTKIKKWRGRSPWRSIILKRF
jgi:PAS domain-containing protein